MRFLSVCSGIEAASVAWLPLGWQCIGVSEIEPFPCAVLKSHYPDVPNYGDMTRYMEWEIKQGDFDLIVGGCPCQAFSIAGLHKGLDDPRGNLTLTFLGLIDQFKPHYVIYENVPGILSDKTRAFEQFLNGLIELGYVFDTDILDARFFGVPQRRRRVFVVAVRADYVNTFDTGGADERPTDDELFSDYEIRSANGGDNKLWQAARKIKFALGATKTRGYGLGQVQTVKGGLHGNIAEGKEKRQGTAESTREVAKSNVSITQTGCASARLANETDTITAGGGHRWASTPLVMYRTHPQDSRYEDCNGDTDSVTASYGMGGNNTPLVLNGCGSKNIMLEDEAMTLTNNGVRTGYGMLATIQNVCIPLDTMSLDERRDKSNACSIGSNGDPSSTISVAHHHAIGAVQGNTAVVRQLTPVECERLQGFPDNYTRIAWRGKSEEGCPNSLRYKALGNSMAVPCMRFIGERVQGLEEALKGCGR